MARLAERVRVDVRVVQPRQDQPAAEVDDSVGLWRAGPIGSCATVQTSG
jgi:hypothetical protein